MSSTRTVPVMARQVAPAAGWRPDVVLKAIVVGAVLVTGWPLVGALRGAQPLQLTVLVAHVAGVLAGYGVVILVGLMSRTPGLELGVGADRLSRWHAAGGRAVVALVLLHAYAATEAWAQSRQQGLVTATWHVLGLPGLLAATLGTGLFLVVAVL